MRYPDNFVEMHAEFLGRVRTDTQSFEMVIVKNQIEHRWFNLDHILSMAEDGDWFKILLGTPVGVDVYRVKKEDWPFISREECLRELEERSKRYTEKILQSPFLMKMEDSNAE